MKRDIKTVLRVVTTNTSAHTPGGQVKSGQKRYITFLSVEPVTRGGQYGAVHLASVGVSNPTLASCVATTNMKWRVQMRATGASERVNCMINGPPFRMPNQIDHDKPLFTIAGGKWLGVGTSSVSARVLVQYYDE